MTRLPERLLSGYRSFIKNHFSYKRTHYQQLALEGQKPEVLVIACCDSRAVPETIFDAKPGEIFTLRNVANLVPPFSPDNQYHATSAALEYAVQLLEVKHIVVFGHAHCGGVSTALKETYKSLSSKDFIGQWIDLLAPAAQTVVRNKLLAMPEQQIALEQLSIHHSLKNLETFPWIKTRKDQGVLTLHGVWFDISSGELWSIEQKTGCFVRVEVW
ncbi:carbonic anhydrase [Bartonella vinsonii]|uniref:Carbonic anhydrase n=1 Tax=Bartonella vinsonii subsp. berkhoffii str. Tweed TaxID=1094502 RepID=N6VIQ3_BARVB|nr:carbonic anhydrase [Bartonella vinsonii]AGF76523.1 carbonic anhydrase [Bartonella vinsonii subsp. berkhoffii str. Winnie]ENN93071.1 carbonic anhydrase [Bartonella vinsonii subsp. berkhoffii str. Tweed]